MVGQGQKTEFGQGLVEITVIGLFIGHIEKIMNGTRIDGRQFSSVNYTGLHILEKR
jgi:hypothetical protein